MRGLFVTATDTNVGKTILSASLLGAMAAAGEPVRAYKPVVTGLGEPPQSGEPAVWAPDHELLAAAAGMRAEEVTSLRYEPAVSPHLAAQLAGRPIDPAQLLADARREPERTLIVEGVGGLLVPLNGRYTVCELAVDIGLPVLIAARAGLGTINHTLLSLRVARSAGLEVRAIVLTPWPARPGPLERSNRETIAMLGEVEVKTLAPVGAPELSRLAAAGEGLPWRRWLSGSAQ